MYCQHHYPFAHNCCIWDQSPRLKVLRYPTRMPSMTGQVGKRCLHSIAHIRSCAPDKCQASLASLHEGHLQTYLFLNRFGAQLQHLGASKSQSVPRNGHLGEDRCWRRSSSQLRMVAMILQQCITGEMLNVTTVQFEESMQCQEGIGPSLCAYCGCEQSHILHMLTILTVTANSILRKSSCVTAASRCGAKDRCASGTKRWIRVVLTCDPRPTAWSIIARACKAEAYVSKALLRECANAASSAEADAKTTKYRGRQHNTQSMQPCREQSRLALTR